MLSNMGKPLVHVQIGIVFEQLVSDALDALLKSNQYSEAVELNSRLFDASTADASLQAVLDFVDLHID